MCIYQYANEVKIISVSNVSEQFRSGYSPTKLPGPVASDSAQTGT